MRTRLLRLSVLILTLLVCGCGAGSPVRAPSSLRVADCPVVPPPPAELMAAPAYCLQTLNFLFESPAGATTRYEACRPTSKP